MNQRTAQLQAILFTSGSPVSKRRLMNLIGCKSDALEMCIAELQKEHEGSGVTVVDDGLYVVLVTNPTLEGFIEKIRHAEHSADLSRASQETLSIIAYAGPISKIDLDFLRGVNTQYTVRRLVIRGLIRGKKEGNNNLLTVTAETLAHLGIRRIEELPEYESVRKSMLDGVASAKDTMNE